MLSQDFSSDKVNDDLPLLLFVFAVIKVSNDEEVEMEPEDGEELLLLLTWLVVLLFRKLWEPRGLLVQVLSKVEELGVSFICEEEELKNAAGKVEEEDTFSRDDGDE